MQNIANRLESKGYTLRSGAAGGADSAFAAGCVNRVEYIPWNGFQGKHHNNGNVMCLSHLDSDWVDFCTKTAEEQHPAWERCSPGAKALHSRNVCQVLGHDNIKSDFVVYWTKVGKGGMPTGGTATAVKLAKSLGIPTYNLNIDSQRESFLERLRGM